MANDFDMLFLIDNIILKDKHKGNIINKKNNKHLNF